MKDNPPKDLETIVREDGRYPLEAFMFLQDGLKRAVKEVYGERAEREEGPHHVTGQQLCYALRDEAIERWGLLARTVLKRWGINSTLDFGRMVFLLTENGLWQKTEEDKLEDFRDVYDFDEAFGPSSLGEEL
ncbi:MAG: hypothetical protein DRI52_11215 [Chloroflexi bacterium]|nr:MAG: hypothetical protein DRI52_11215 [Chloroflexota bacterium]